MSESVNTPAGTAFPGLGPAQSATLERRSAMSMSRYWEGYLHARALNGFGATIKAVSLSVGGLLALIGFFSCAKSQNNMFDSPIGGFLMFLFGVFVGAFGYVLSVLVQAAGQLLKAHFDCAVNGSHFLNDDQRAKVMSLE